MTDEKTSVAPNSPTAAANTTTGATKFSQVSANDKAKKNLFSDSKDGSRHCNSLPLFQNVSELCEIGSRPGMECMPLRTPPGPYHHYHHVADQTKSLQELQNEVGALLEFRDLVIETFPDLKHKMASMSATNTLTGMASSSLASRREWEPGIRVKRKITPKDNAEMSSSSLIRSRSNSHSGKKEPKSGEGNGSVVQDSGFSTETSSSKEAHSASSTTGAMQGAGASNRLPIDADDELLNLLDVIHRKSNRLRDEVEHLQNIERTKLRRNVNSSENSCLNKTFQEHVDRLNKEDIQILRKERDRLLDKLAEMEAETLAGRIKATKMQDQFEELCSVKKELEEQLKLALSQKLELNTRLHELHKQYSNNKSSSSSPSESTSNRLSSASTVLLTGITAQQNLQGAPMTTNRLLTTTSSTTAASVVTGTTTFTPVVVDQSNIDDNKTFYPFHSDIKQIKNDLKNLGRLDGLISSPNRVSKVRVTDSKKIAAILLETNVLELQRHLLTLTVQNQVLTQRLEQATKSKMFLMKKLDKSKEDLDDLRFQLEEKDIELEGTKAQLRVLEAKTPSKLDFSTETNRSSSTIILSSRDSPVTPTQISTPSMKAMIPLPMDEVQQHSSSTESAQDQTEREARLGTETPKRRPSKIPLPGTKGYLAPKPPTGRANQKSPGSGPVSNKSLSRSTGNLYGRSGPSSVRRDNMQTPSLNRPESAQSLRKDSSLGTNSRSSSSSIPISAKSTPSPHKISSSPLPKPKRDSLTSRVRHLDSLSRVHNSATSPTGNTNNNSNVSTNNNNSSHLMTGSSTNLYKLNSSSKKDLSSSFTQGQSRDRKQSAASVRRVSSASVGRSATVDLQQNDSDSGKMIKIRKVESMDSLMEYSNNHEITKNCQKPIYSRDLIKEYMAKACPPPAILRPSHLAYELPSPDSQIELAYKHPQLLFEMELDDEEHSFNYQTNKEIEIKYVNTLPEAELGWSTDNTIKTNQCRLIGRVNPNIAKTWDQLNAVSCSRNLSRSVSNNSDDSEKILFYQPVQESRDNFQVNKVIYSEEETESSCDFYDSIDDIVSHDNNNNSNNSNNPNFENIVSICQQGEAGEQMAEIDSFERKKYCWSFESECK